jgi:TrmH RNA methyltransferase
MRSARPPERRRPARNAAAPAEVRRFGFAACRAIVARRREDVRKLWLAEARVADFRDALAWFARRRIGYRIVAEDELERLAASKHHEGIVIDVLERPPQTLAGWIAGLPASGAAQVLWLGGVGNPHNLGAILRSAAHFGAAAVIAGPGSARLSGAACRVAEGGAEAVPYLIGSDPGADFAALRAGGFRPIATSSHARDAVHAADLPPRVAWLIGAEGEGLDPRLVRAADACLAIAGTGAVESLNVSAAVAVLLAEHRRRYPG